MTMEAAWHTVPGGTGRVAVDLAEALSQRDDIAIRGVSAWHIRQPTQNFRPTIDIARLPLPRPLLYETWSRMSFPQLKTRNDSIIHSTTIVAPPPGKSPLVVSVHDLAFRRFPERFPLRARRLFERSWQQVLARSDAVICPSAATSADLIAAGLDTERLHLVSLGHDPYEVTQEQVSRTLNKLQIPEEFILVVGTLEPRKNIPTLIEAFRHIAPKTSAQLVIAGPTGWGLTAQDLLRPLDQSIRNRVSIVGEVQHQDLAALYTQSSVFCYPSLLEGFGLPVLEAMSYGAPVITSKGTSTEEVAGNAAITINPQSPIEIGEALEFLLTDRSAAREISLRGLERSKCFTWAKAAANTVDVYKRLL